jgi:uncharacterized membrane protein
VPQVRETIDIRAPQDTVFNAITDPRRTMEWNPNIIDLKGLKGVPVGVGSTWIQTTSIAGRPLALNCRVARWDAPRLGVLDVSGSQQATITTECVPVSGGTRVVQTIDFTPPGGFLGAMAGGLIGQQLARELRTSLQRQKTTLERELGGASGSRTA